MPQANEGKSDLVPAATGGGAEQTLETGRGHDLARRHPHADRPGFAAKRQKAAQALLLGGRRWRHSARYLGIVIFFIGAGLLGYVFWEALQGFQRFSNAGYLSGQLNLAGDDAGVVPWNRIQRAIAVFGSELLRVLYLLLLGFLASAIAAKGIQFFAASEAVIDEAVIDENLLVEYEDG